MGLVFVNTYADTNKVRNYYRNEYTHDKKMHDKLANENPDVIGHYNPMIAHVSNRYGDDMIEVSDEQTLVGVAQSQVYSDGKNISVVVTFDTDTINKIKEGMVKVKATKNDDNSNGFFDWF
jgi:hypothetical protein